MTISREHWKPPFATSPLSTSAVPRFPPWLCPGCQSGTLALDKDTFKVVETGVSKGCRAHEAWDADWIDERFAGLLVCQNEACGEIVAIGGRTHHSEDLDWERQQQNWYREFEPVFMYPAPPVFPIPAKCPKAVSAQLKRAFLLFWCDLGSCANRLRAAAEALLTDRRIPRRRINDKGKHERIPLHLRIEKFKQTDALAARPRPGRRQGDPQKLGGSARGRIRLPPLHAGKIEPHNIRPVGNGLGRGAGHLDVWS